jgi:hypothetical protein
MKYLMLNSQRIDPSRTITLRKAFLREYRKRARLVRAELTSLIKSQDDYTLGFFDASSFFQTTNPFGALWVNEFIEKAHRKGMERAYSDVRRRMQVQSPGIFAATQREFISAISKKQETSLSFTLMMEVANESVNNIVSKLSADIRRAVFYGTLQELTPRQLNQSFVQIFQKAEKAITKVVRTEVVRAHAEGQLDMLEFMDVQEIVALVEWTTADKPCSLCSAMAGTVFTVKEARGLIPRHPNCMCSWIPASRKRSQERIKQAIRRSVKLQYPKARNLKMVSGWPGVKVL